MSEFPWICPACKAAVAGGEPQCPGCGCPEGAGEAVVDHHMRSRVIDSGRPMRKSAQCPKCPGEMSVRGELRGSAGGISAVFELSNARFDYVSCIRCGYTEFYRSEVSGVGQLTDLFVG